MKNDFRDEIRKDLARLRDDAGITGRTYIGAKESKEYNEILKNGGQLPENVCVHTDVNGNEYDSSYYTEETSGFTQDELMEYIMLKQLRNIRTIKQLLITFFIIIPSISFLIFLIFAAVPH